MKSIFVLCFCLLFSCIIGCDTFFTSTPEQGETFDQPLDGLTPEQQLAFVRGDEAFEKRFSFNEGLGPIFNQPSCESCHPADGKGHPLSNLTRFGINNGTTFDILSEAGGPQLQDRAVPGILPEAIPAHANAISVRSGPVVFGLGLIEMIPDMEILSYTDPDDLDSDGISGKPNFVPAPGWITQQPGPHNGKFLGRFGRKAGVGFLLQQIATAYYQDMGITTEFFPQDNPHPQRGIFADQRPDPEIPMATLHDVAAYLQMLAPPNRGAQTEQVQQGETLFAQIGCASCHVPSMQTGFHPTIKALSYKPVSLYSDLLLHDMGDELADNFIEGDANGKEWRTTPLWGLRLFEEQLGGTAYYLHDGRTSDLSEAIRLHGGEAEPSRNSFLGLSESERQALLAFLKSL
ncbi:MAG: thiol oxidoreductase [Bacteroidetes bacterium]|nr:MAG: thiol oxidoreductase [Bacteroidota bacterium]